MDFSIHLGHSRMGTPLIWHQNSNAHLYVSGQSGRGKSYFLKHCIAQLPQQGVHCIVFDRAGDLNPFSEKRSAGTEPPFQSLNIRTQVGINPFRTLCLPNGQPERHYDTAARVAETIVSAASVRSDLQKIYLQNVLMECLEQCGAHFGFSDLIQQIQDRQSLARTMAPILLRLQELDSLLPHDSPAFHWDLARPGITVLQFDSIPHLSAQIMVTQFLLFDLWSEKLSLGQGSCPVVVVLDECQHFRFTENSIFNRILREGRKYGVSGWFASQWIDHEQTVKALNQADLQAYFYPGHHQVNTLARRLAHGTQQVNDYKQLIYGLEIGEFLYMDSHGTPVVNCVPRI